ncbi:MAG: hypothetical protein NZM29_01280 [Nitrospira sp.]|nr:hypothetical protein [Nitrospira sp.]
MELRGLAFKEVGDRPVFGKNREELVRKVSRRGDASSHFGGGLCRQLMLALNDEYDGDGGHGKQGPDADHGGQQSFQPGRGEGAEVGNAGRFRTGGIAAGGPTGRLLVQVVCVVIVARGPLGWLGSRRGEGRRSARGLRLRRLGRITVSHDRPPITAT